MEIYYLFIEGKPYIDNEESKEIAGAYINCWVKARDELTAMYAAIDFIRSQEWEVISIEEVYVAKRDKYISIPESLECYDQANSSGVDAIFYTWPIDEEEDILNGK